MKYAIIKCINGAFTVDTEHGTLNAAKVREADDFPVSVFTNYDPDPFRISVCRAGSVHAIFHVVPTEMSISDILQRTVIKKISIPDKKIFIAADSGCLILCQPGIVRVITLRNHGVLFSDKQLRGSMHRDGEGQQELAVQRAIGLICAECGRIGGKDYRMIACLLDSGPQMTVAVHRRP